MEEGRGRCDQGKGKEDGGSEGEGIMKGNGEGMEEGRVGWIREQS